jgi:O-antigen/teichoic acid export membrane protein
VAANCGARVAAILGLALATVLVARVGGPEAVGAYALLRMLPGLLGVLAVAGLPGALAYFLAENRRKRPATWPTLLAIGTAGAVVGTLAWLLLSPVLARVFFQGQSATAVLLAGGTVATQLVLTLGKTALQGLQDRRGGDLVIAAEEIGFLPCYLLVLLGGLHGLTALVLGLALADLLVGTEAWRRVAVQVRRDHPGSTARSVLLGRPDMALGREVVTYGIRGQVGGLITLLNLRLDFAILGALAGPAALGTYAVASKYAELLRLPGTALTWVSYPELAADSPERASARARRLVRPALLGVWAASVPMFLVTAPVVSLLYGARFADAVPQSRLLLVGMLLGGAAGVSSGYLYARGRPGLNSLAMGLGLVVTVALDLLLIPRYGAMGAATASTTAYLLGDLVLVVLLLRLTRRRDATTPHTDPVLEAST